MKIENVSSLLKLYDKRNPVYKREKPGCKTFKYRFYSRVFIMTEIFNFLPVRPAVGDSSSESAVLLPGWKPGYPD